LRKKVAQIQRWGVVGESLENLEGECGLALRVPHSLEFFVAVEILAELEELTVLRGD
jgi:hypothetical protein